MAESSFSDHLVLNVSRSELLMLQESPTNNQETELINQTDKHVTDGVEELEKPLQDLELGESADNGLTGAEDHDEAHDEHSATTEELDADTESNHDVLLQQPANPLYCALCSKVSTEPKLLPCFHTFCLNCLEKIRGEKHRFIFCPICRNKSSIPKDGLTHLMDNRIVSSLIAAQERESTASVSNCVVCQLHGVERQSVGRCQTCGDTLCDDCCDKHTFSRQTASHKVVRIGSSLPDSNSIMPQPHVSDPLFCSVHTTEELKFYCKTCSLSVCRDCILLEHGKHSSALSESLYQNVRDDVQAEMKLLKSAYEKKMEFTLEHSLDIISEAENEQLAKLDGAKDEIVSLIETKFHKYKAAVQEEFQKCRSYCETRNKFLDSQRNRIEMAADNFEFYLQSEQLSAVVELQKPMHDYLHHLNRVLNQTFTPLEESKLPTVATAEDNFRNISNLKFINLNTFQGKKKDGPKSNATKPNQSHSAVTNVKTKPSPPQVGQQGPRKEQTTVKKQGPKSTSTGSVPGVKNQAQGSYSQLLTGARKGIGRGMVQLTDDIPSLLGPYPGSVKGFGSHGIGPHGDGRSCQANTSQSCFHGNKNNGMHDISGFGLMSEQQSKGSIMLKKPSNQPQYTNLQMPTPLTIGRRINVHLSGNINCRTRHDLNDLDITGLSFARPDVIVVSDANNKNLKVFDVKGTWLDLIADDNPRSVTHCEDHFVWNSMSDAGIKTYNITAQRFGPKKHLNTRRLHPLTSYRDNKYIVANLKNSQIQACAINGEVIHTLVAKDGQGKPLKTVCQIAACFEDQLVLVDKSLNRVVINNFDGDFIGEYMEARWSPGGLTIDHLGNIFVTDYMSHRIILLSKDGHFLQDWMTNIDRPFCLACNLNGVLAVSGSGNTVFLYQYQYCT